MQYILTLLDFCPTRMYTSQTEVVKILPQPGNFWIKENDRNISKGRHTHNNSIRDARTAQPGEIFFNTMRYRSSEKVHSWDTFRALHVKIKY